MRTLSSAITTKQDAASKIPYVKLLFTSADGGTTRDYSSRLLQLEHHEEAYNDYATLELYDNDAGVADIRGYWVQIGYGFYTGNNVAEPNGDNAGNEYSYTARLWVKHQQRISAEGILVQRLQLEGMWTWLYEQYFTEGSPPYYTKEYTADTVYAILTIIFTMANMSLDALGTENDSIINTYTPQFQVNNVPFERLRTVIQRLIRMTKCYLRAEAGLEWKVVYPETSDEADATFYSGQTPFFYEYMESYNVVMPNSIKVVYNFTDEDITTAEVYEGSAGIDQTEIDRYTEVPWLEIAGEITSLADAANRAAALLTRALAESMSCRLIIPHHCGLELYDNVEVYDSR